MALPYDDVCGSADREAWLEHRLTGIGASEISSVMGANKYEGPLKLYARKVNAIPLNEGERSEAAEWGLLLERLVAQVWSGRTGKQHRWHGRLLRSKEHPWALATLDARVVGEKLPLECKTMTVYLEKEWENGTPLYYQYQTHQQMLVTGAHAVYAACLVGGQRLVWDVVERDEEMIKEIIAKGSEFWARVQERREPIATGAEGDEEALAALHSRNDGKHVMLGADVDELDAQRMTLFQMKRDADAKAKELKQALHAFDMRIVQKLGDATQGLTPFGIIYEHKQIKRAGYTVAPCEYTQLYRKDRSVKKAG